MHVFITLYLITMYNYSVFPLWPRRGNILQWALSHMFSHLISKPWASKIVKLHFINVKNIVLQMTLLKKWKMKPQNGRNYFQSCANSGFVSRMNKGVIESFTAH